MATEGSNTGPSIPMKELLDIIVPLVAIAASFILTAVVIVSLVYALGTLLGGM